jgi:hypothetical protein
MKSWIREGRRKRKLKKGKSPEKVKAKKKS